jgi:hypothetical protein
MANLGDIMSGVGDVVETLFGSSKQKVKTKQGDFIGQTPLEKKGMEARDAHLERNEWRKNYLEYTRALVLAEYAVQNEFKISSSDEPIVTNRGGLETVSEQYERRKKQTSKKKEKNKDS